MKVDGEPSEEDEEAEQTIANQNSQENRILEKIKNFEKKTNNISYSLCSMAQRQDERTKMILGQQKADEF